MHERESRIRALEVTIAALKIKIHENEIKILDDVPYAWNVFAFLKTRLSEKERVVFRMQVIDAHNVIRINQKSLDKEQVRLQGLKDDLAEREEREELRLSVERVKKAKRERLAREKIEEARRRARTAEEAKDRAAREAAERVHQREQAAYEARQRAAREAEEEHSRKMETLYTNFQRRQKDEARKAQEEQTRKDQAHKTCKHAGWWDKVSDRHDCTHCTRPLFKFTEQCSSCGIMAYTSCRDILKAGSAPLSYRERYGRSSGPSRPTPTELLFAIVALLLCQQGSKAVSRFLQTDKSPRRRWFD
jgi:hypothetical protein